MFVGRVDERDVYCDVYFDAAWFVHPIYLGERLKLDFPTLTVTDLLMLKLQMRRRSLRDRLHETMLLADHPLVQEEGDFVNTAVLERRIRNDRRCYQTFVGELDALEKWVAVDIATRSKELANATMEKCRSLKMALENCDKGFRWHVERIFGFALPEPPEPEEMDTPESVK
jgi:hypothetical protein